MGELMRNEALTAAGSDALPLLGHSLGQQPSGAPFSYDTFRGFELPKASSAAAAALHEAVGMLASQASLDKRASQQGMQASRACGHAQCLGLGALHQPMSRLL